MIKSICGISFVCSIAFPFCSLADPNAPMIASSEISNVTTISNVSASGLQGSETKGGGGGSFFGVVSVKGEGGVKRSVLSASLSTGAVEVNSGTLTNSKIKNFTTATNVKAKGADVGLGYIRIGR